MKPARHISGAPESVSAFGRPRCRWCGEDVKPPRRTFCSDRCVEEWVLRSTSGGARSACLHRDGGVCAECGLNTLALKRDVHLAISGALNGLPLSGRFWKRVAAMVAARLAAHGYRAPRDLAEFQSDGFYWQADHIVPVEAGGGLAGLDNLQTLCSPCHRRKTAAQKRGKT